MALGHLYEFGPFRLQAAEHHLFRQDEMVPLTPKAIDTLVYLVEHHEHTIGKEELIQNIWPGTFVEDGSLTQVIWMLRKTLGDSAESHQYIATIPKRGYRFVAPVREIQAVETQENETPREQAAPIEASSPVRGAESISAGLAAGKLRRGRLTGIALLTVVTLSAPAYFLWQRFQPRPPQASRRVMLVVLPVQNLTGDPEREYMSDGLTEEMIAQLGSMNPQRLGVIARTSSMAYKKTDKTVDQIGRELGVDYVLETSLRGSGDRLRVTTQLIRSRDQTHVWAHEYDRSVSDTVTLQEDFSRAIAEQIEVRLAPQEQARLTSGRPVNPQAFDAYLKGRFFWNKRSPEDLKTSLRYFQQAIEADPNYAPAYTGIADSYQLLVYFDQLKGNDGFPKARAAALKSLELDDKLAEAHTSLASIKGDFEWDWTGADAEYRRALELNSNYATAHHWYADFLAGTGRLQEGTAEIQRAREIDPLSPVIGVTLGQMYCRADHCDLGIAEYKKVLEMYPTFLQARAALSEGYAQLGKYQESLAEIGGQFPPGPHGPVLWGYALWGHALALSGRRQAALKVAEDVKRQIGWEHLDYTLAIIYAGLGDKDQAFARLEGARRSHDYYMPNFRVDPKLISLRSDPRYPELLRRMNLPLDQH